MFFIFLLKLTRKRLVKRYFIYFGAVRFNLKKFFYRKIILSPTFILFLSEIPDGSSSTYFEVYF